jgi:hypothetical protein
MRLLPIPVLLLLLVAVAGASERQLIVSCEGYSWMIHSDAARQQARVAAYVDQDRSLGVHYTAHCREAKGRVLAITAQDSLVAGPQRNNWAPDSFVIDLQTGRCFKWDEHGNVRHDARVIMSAAGKEPEIFTALANAAALPEQRAAPPQSGADDF